MARAALILVILLVVWATAGAVLLGQLAENRERRAAEAVAAVRALVDEAPQSLSRDAALLARDVHTSLSPDEPGRWSTDSSDMWPQRVVTSTAGRGIDLAVILDPDGGPIVQKSDKRVGRRRIDAEGAVVVGEALLGEAEVEQDFPPLLAALRLQVEGEAVLGEQRRARGDRQRRAPHGDVAEAATAGEDVVDVVDDVGQDQAVDGRDAAALGDGEAGAADPAEGEGNRGDAPTGLPGVGIGSGASTTPPDPWAQ